MKTKLIITSENRLRLKGDIFDSLRDAINYISKRTMKKQVFLMNEADFEDIKKWAEEEGK